MKYARRKPKRIKSKVFAVTVKRSYTTVVEIELPHTMKLLDVQRVCNDYKVGQSSLNLHRQIWDNVSQKELEQMNCHTETLQVQHIGYR